MSAFSKRVKIALELKMMFGSWQLFFGFMETASGLVWPYSSLDLVQGD